MQAGSSSEGPVPKPARSRETSPLAVALVTGVFTLAGAGVAIWQTELQTEVTIQQTEREADLSLRDLRMETYATALQSLYTYRDALDAYHEAVLSPENREDDAAAFDDIGRQYPEYLAAWSRVRLVATPELRKRLDNVSAEINEMRKNIEAVANGSFGGDSLDVYIGEDDPVVKEVLAFQEQAILETREAD